MTIAAFLHKHMLIAVVVFPTEVRDSAFRSREVVQILPWDKAAITQLIGKCLREPRSATLRAFSIGYNPHSTTELATPSELFEAFNRVPPSAISIIRVHTDIDGTRKTEVWLSTPPNQTL